MKLIATIIGALWWALLALEGGPLLAIVLGSLGTLALVGVVTLHEAPHGAESDTIEGEEA